MRVFGVGAVEPGSLQIGGPEVGPAQLRVAQITTQERATREIGPAQNRFSEVARDEYDPLQIHAREIDPPQVESFEHLSGLRRPYDSGGRCGADSLLGDAGQSHKGARNPYVTGVRLIREASVLGPWHPHLVEPDGPSLEGPYEVNSVTTYGAGSSRVPVFTI